VQCVVSYHAVLWSLIVVLALSSEPVYAEWVAILTSPNLGGYTAYGAPDTIRRKGNVAKMWHLHDFKTIQTVAGISFLSRKAQIEYDCAEERHRTLALTEFSGNMGKGEVVFISSDEQKWEPVAPESIGRVLWKAACGKE
jgi:surface-adhesin protein E